MATDDILYIEYMDIGELQGQEDNPKGHDLEALGRSYDRFGYREPLIFDETGARLVAGHGRLKRLQERWQMGAEPPQYIQVVDGRWKAPVVRGGAFTSQEEAIAYVITANRLTESGGWNEQALVPLLEQMQATAKGLPPGCSPTFLSELQLRLGQEGKMEIDLSRFSTPDPTQEFRWWVVAENLGYDEARELAKGWEGAKVEQYRP